MAAPLPLPRPPRRQPPMRHGHAFYTTALVISLFACYSIIRSFAHEQIDPALHARSLGIRDQECRLVRSSSDQCAFVKANCLDEEAGLLSYLQLYYCTLHDAKPVAFTILVVWISLLFSTIGIAASDFLCINLSTIASILGMSESLTGVTFLAFGNGSPDVFSTFAAMSSHSGSLAVGELIGAAGFITAVVAGSMAITQPFRVARRSFVRDVGFFAVAASFSLVFLADGSLRLWECASMIAFYVFYVIFVVVWHWRLSRTRRMKLAEVAARLQHHIPNQQELEVPQVDDDDEARPAGESSRLLRPHSDESIPTLLTPGSPGWKSQEDEDDETRDRYLAELQANMRVRPPGTRRNTMTPIRPSLIGALEFRAVLSSLERKSTGNSLSLRRFSEDTSQLLDGAQPTTRSYPPPQTDLLDPENAQRYSGNSGRSRAVSANDAQGLKIDTNLLSPIPSEFAISTGSTTPTDSKHTRASAAFLQNLDVPGRPTSPKFLLSPADMSDSSDPTDQPQLQSPKHLAPPGQSFRRPDYSDDHQQQSRSPLLSPMQGPTLHVPTLHSPHPENIHQKSPLFHEYAAHQDSPHSTPRHSSASSIRLPAPSMSPESNPDVIVLTDGEEEELKVYKWWPYRYLPAPQMIVSTLFPTLYGWRDKSVVDKFLGLVTAPSVFLLTITLPVLDAGNDNEAPSPDPARTPRAPSRQSTGGRLAPDTPSIQPQRNRAEAPAHPHSAISRQNSMRNKNSLSASDEYSIPTSSAKDWHRWLVFLQVFTAPLFTVVIIWANVDDDQSGMLVTRMILGSLVVSLIVLAILLATTEHDREPKYRPLFCFLGFAVAIAWISTIANEVVGVLKAFGVILNISDAILGLTIFAVGNSCGDLVADITVAKLGYPVMALSACFGGPMLNILLGIGVSGMYMTIRGAAHKHAKHPSKPIKYTPYEIEVSTTLVVSGVTLLVTLLGLLIVVPLNDWRMDRKVGIGLIVLWTLSTIGNVIIEVLGYGGQLEL